ncbi:MAG: hypothetical protein IJX17_01740, partial [Clostridia bacterium]|nr:hypothetical protein [Clostridia bacterium]
KHTEKAPVIENIVKATVGNDGSYDSVVYCDICGTEISRTPNKINKINESDIVLESGNYTYNGQEFTPSITITNLVLDRDYTITYVNNVNAGTASVKITFKGNYAGEYTKNFVINAVKVEKPVITGTYTYTGEEQTATLTNIGDGNLYTITGNKQTNAGSYKVKVTFKDNKNYTWSDETSSELTLDFIIESLDINYITSKLETISYVYSGEENLPKVTLTHQSKVLILNTDYTITYLNNIEVGTGSAIIKGKGNYTGTLTKYFEILANNTSDNTETMSKIGIGGGGAFFNPMIDPNDENIYYVTSDMGSLYYSYNKGESWSRTNARGVFTQTHISSNSNVFAGGFGLYASYDKGKTIELIYPKNVKKTVSRCGWNENLMLADNYDNGYVKSITSNETTLYFTTIDWEGNLRFMQCDHNGNNLEILYTEKFSISDPMSDIDIFSATNNEGVYISLGTKILHYNFNNKSFTNTYTAKGYIKDLTIIDEYIFFIDDTELKSEILYTKDFINFRDLLSYNDLTTTFTKYGKTSTFNWHFKEISGINFDNIFLSFSSKINEQSLNEYEDTVDGIMKFNGLKFEWVFDSMYKTKHTLDLNGWSYGAHAPIYGIYASPHSEDVCLVSNIETVYYMKYEQEETKYIQTLHTYDHNDGTFSTNGLDCQTTYFVREDPFNKDHIIICTTDMGLQNSFDGGNSWRRMEITLDDYSIFNTCYDLYFDKYTSGKVYALWSSRHDAPYNPTIYDKDYTRGAFAVSTDGGITWDFSYSTGLPIDSIPVKMSIIHNETTFTIAVATFNRGFYLSTDAGKTFESLNSSIETVEGLIYGEDIVIANNSIYMLTAPYLELGNWKPAKLYEYNITTKTTSNLDLGVIVLARSLTYHSDKGLFINVIPTYNGKWFDEYNGWIFVNENGGIYHYENGKFELYFENEDGIFHSDFSDDGTLYAVDTYGKVFAITEDSQTLFKDGLFTMLKNVSFSNDGKTLYITAFGGGTYKFTL